MNITDSAILGDALRFHARARGDKPALVMDGRSVSYFELNARTNRLNGALRSLGLVPGDRVAILSRNRPEYLEVVGIAKSGLVSVLLNWRLVARELVHPLTDSRPKAIIVEPIFLPIIDGLRDQLPWLRHFVVLGEECQGWTAYASLLEQGDPQEPEARVEPDDPACTMYSSGTTGRPKGIVLTHRSIMSNARCCTSTFELTAENRVLVTMPLFHVGGLWYHAFAGLTSGATLILLAEFDPAKVLDAIGRQRIDHIHVVPTMIDSLLNHPQCASTDKRGLRTLMYAASSIPEALLRRALAAFPDSRFYQGYGSTEAGIVTALSPEDHSRALEQPGMQKLLLSCGRALFGCDVAIQSLNDEDEIAPGTLGEIVVRGERMMSGYWNNPDATREAMRDGWLRTGDLGYMDEDGYLYIVDRKNDMIVTGGENVYPREVEDALYGLSDVAEAAVFGLPDPRWVEKVTAAIVLKPGCKTSVEQILGQVRPLLAGYKCPKDIFIVDQLPKTGSGKVLKRALRQHFSSQPSP